MRSIYQPFQRNHERMLVMDIRSAELTKYAANAMLATRISFMNELANLAEKLGADIELVRKGIGSDPRIGYSFFCIRAAAMAARVFPRMSKRCAAPPANTAWICKCSAQWSRSTTRKKERLLQKVIDRFGEDLRGRRFALWGLAFKPRTDDMREAPSLVIIDACSAAARPCAPLTRSPCRKPVTRWAIASITRCPRWARSPTRRVVDRDGMERIPVPGL